MSHRGMSLKSQNLNWPITEARYRFLIMRAASRSWMPHLCVYGLEFQTGPHLIDWNRVTGKSDRFRDRCHQ